MQLFALLALCLVAAAVAIVLSQYKKEYAIAVTVAAGAMLITATASFVIRPVTEIVDKLRNAGVNTEFFFVAIKALGLGYVTQFIADTCRDFGQTSLAAKAEFVGRAAMFVISLPLINSLFDAVTSLVG
ncbi:MAG: stage III sporulation AC/AD family protein [Acutalibacteraceae bacterium]|nr:stage III sporulation AC/AD family protein [Acutalibacteraceae bacterium]